MGAGEEPKGGWRGAEGGLESSQRGAEGELRRRQDGAGKESAKEKQTTVEGRS